ncbi:polysaccharide deacetylase family protein [Zhongshania sp.]|jgi:peptidoglycan/xylan/chitin deacetylase (PgdA/CDA1 family)|uniref:polysaccharide deacetylase family protein n=1 Tax=Zhongshania sp. TaxID=1971902 RepID=UPI002A818AB6|nr:polysaccharide deacetylase family protein [Zhongshania sp.]
MSVSDDYLQYPQRHYGMDHERYSWSMLADRKPVQWPEGKKLALWVNVNLQFYPMNQRGVPFAVPGGMTMPYPDLRHYSLRDYGNRVGLFRIIKALDRFGVTPSFAVNSRLLERTPYLVGLLRERGNEILGHGLHMDALHYGGQDEGEERAQIRESLDCLRELTQQAVHGWLSPVRNESENTPDLLAEHDIRYFADWVNDDMPYQFSTRTKPLIAMPLSNEVEDRFVIVSNQHSEASWAEQVDDAANYLLAEAQASGGRMLGLNIHPWLLGHAHRIKFFEDVLATLSANPLVWSASPSAILDTWSEQQ